MRDEETTVYLLESRRAIEQSQELLRGSHYLNCQTKQRVTLSWNAVDRSWNNLQKVRSRPFSVADLPDRQQP